MKLKGGVFTYSFLGNEFSSYGDQLQPFGKW